MSRRTRSPHPGVVLLPPEADHSTWRARYDDPDTGRRVKVRLDPAALRTTELRRDWAIKKSRALAKRRMELDAGAPVASGTGLADAIAQYFRDHARLRPRTLEIYRGATGKLEAWATKHGIRTADDLTGPRLVALRAELAKEKRTVHQKGGKRGALKVTQEPRSPASVNVELRAIGTVLTYLRRLGLLARLSSDDIRDGLKKLSENVERIDYRKPHELQKLLEAALRHDAAVFAATREEHAGLRPLGSTLRYQPIAPLVAASLVTGMRIGELLTLEWPAVDLEALDNEGRVVGEIHVSAASKTKRARTVGLEVSPALRKMLVAMHLKSGGKGSVFGLGRGEAKAAERRLVAEFGAPRGSNWQALRRTCGTFLTNAPGIFGAASAYRSAKQLGHSITVAERHYLDVMRGIPRDARTLEAAMQIEEQMRLVIASVTARPARARKTA